MKIWSGKRDSNSRPRPWQGRALPTELFPHRVDAVASDDTHYHLDCDRSFFGAGNETCNWPTLGRDPWGRASTLFSAIFQQTLFFLERETRFELATPTLARSCSTN